MLIIRCASKNARVGSRAQRRKQTKLRAYIHYIVIIITKSARTATAIIIIIISIAYMHLHTAYDAHKSPVLLHALNLLTVFAAAQRETNHIEYIAG